MFLFFYGFPVSDQNKPILGNGASTNHLFIFATTLKLLQINCDTNNQSNIALFHIDGTYKITREGFPMLVFGRSNLNRKIYPIAFGIVSNEEAYDFLHFFQSIKSLCRFFNINFELNFLMQDAQSACSSAAKQVFPNVNILMCWFHLKQAVKKNLDTKNVSNLKRWLKVTSIKCIIQQVWKILKY